MSPFSAISKLDIREMFGKVLENQTSEKVPEKRLKITRLENLRKRPTLDLSGGQRKGFL